MVLLANSKQQDLIEHSLQVSKVGVDIADYFLSDFDSNVFDMVQFSVKMSGLCHDIGKVVDDFQSYIKRDLDYQADLGEGCSYSFENPLHHEISLVLFDAIWGHVESFLLPTRLSTLSEKREIRAQIRYGIYWHHAEPVRSKSLERTISDYFNDGYDISSLLEKTNLFVSELIGCEVQVTESDFISSVDNIKAVPFFDVSTAMPSNHQHWVKFFQKDLDKNLCRFLVRFLTISADRHVSSLPAEEINKAVVNTRFDDSQLLSCIQDYINSPELAGERTNRQMEAADCATHYDSNVIVGAAGCGKTRTALMAYFKSRTETESRHSGLLWSCPRVAVALSILDEIKNNLPNVKVAILTGESQAVWSHDEVIECDIFDADIVITTIDQSAKWLTSNGASSSLGEFINRYVVFDEYHELFAIQSLYYISALLMRLKEHQSNAHVFISATPEPMNLQLICKGSSSWQYPVVLKSFNNSPININFVNTIKEDEEGAIYILNTATRAQDLAMKSWINGREDISCYHSKFTPEHKAGLTQHVLSRFGKKTDDYKATLFAGPIAQASLNISRQRLNTELSTPANIIQRIGRANRFAEFGMSHVQILSGKDQVWEKKGIYGPYGLLKNTGSRKISIKKDKVIINPRAHYYSFSSYLFFQGLIKTLGHDNVKPKKLAGNSLRTSLNELNDFYLKFSIAQVEQAGRLTEETKEFVIDAICYLDAVQLYKPRKLTVNTKSGKEVGVSYRGGSLWATMSSVDISIDGCSATGLIGLPDDRDRLVSVSEGETFDINTLANLTDTIEVDFKKLKSSLKFRAGNSGRSKQYHLIHLAKSSSYPVVCSTPNRTNKTGLYYLTVTNKNNNTMNIGFKRAENGLNTLNTELQGN